MCSSDENKLDEEFSIYGITGTAMGSLLVVYCSFCSAPEKMLVTFHAGDMEERRLGVAGKGKEAKSCPFSSLTTSLEY